jgi:hypothetical protein
MGVFQDGIDPEIGEEYLDFVRKGVPMIRATCCLLLPLLAAVTMAGQCPSPIQGGFANGQATITLETLSPGKPSRSQTIVVHPTAPMCPVQMHALQGPGSSLLAVSGNEAQVSGPTQRIHLVLSQGRAAEVAGARIRIEGLSGKNHIAAAACGQEASPDRTQTLNVTFTEERQAESSTDLVLAGFTSVQSIEILSITYRDGSTWRLESHNACEVAPDPMMRVANR